MPWCHHKGGRLSVPNKRQKLGRPGVWHLCWRDIQTGHYIVVIYFKKQTKTKDLDAPCLFGKLSSTVVSSLVNAEASFCHNQCFLLVQKKHVVSTGEGAQDDQVTDFKFSKEKIGTPASSVTPVCILPSTQILEALDSVCVKADENHKAWWCTVMNSTSFLCINCKFKYSWCDCYLIIYKCYFCNPGSMVESIRTSTLNKQCNLN